jgi:hypothetical protein
MKKMTLVLCVSISLFFICSLAQAAECAYPVPDWHAYVVNKSSSKITCQALSYASSYNHDCYSSGVVMPNGKVKLRIVACECNNGYLGKMGVDCYANGNKGYSLKMRIKRGTQLTYTHGKLE